MKSVLPRSCNVFLKKSSAFYSVVYIKLHVRLDFTIEANTMSTGETAFEWEKIVHLSLKGTATLMITIFYMKDINKP